MFGARHQPPTPDERPIQFHGRVASRFGGSLFASENATRARSQSAAEAQPLSAFNPVKSR
jgi:hypothetical protein